MAKTDCCCNCVYGCRDGGLWLRTLFSGFPAGPMCANHPDTPGIMREVPGRPCRNYRRKPPEPGADAKRIILTNGMVAYVDAADYDELSKYAWSSVSGGYAGRREKGALVLMHRQIMNPPEGMVVDHIKGNRLDNTRAHLRVCTAWENSQNRVKHPGATSRHIGVYYRADRKKWVGLIRLEGKPRQIGSYNDELEAARAYDHVAVQHLGDNARLNFPEEWPPERRARVRAERDDERQRTKDRRQRTAHAETRRRRDRKPRATGHKPRPTKRQGPPTGRQR